MPFHSGCIVLHSVYTFLPPLIFYAFAYFYHYNRHHNMSMKYRSLLVLIYILLMIIDDENLICAYWPLCIFFRIFLLKYSLLIFSLSFKIWFQNNVLTSNCR